MKIPQPILDDFKTHSATPSPRITVRAMTDAWGNLGETYLLSDGTALTLYSGKLSEEYEQYEIKFRDLVDMSLELDRPFVFLKVVTATEALRLKCAVFDLEPLHQLCDLAGHEQPKTAVRRMGTTDRMITIARRASSAVADEAPIVFSPMIGFCAMLQALVNLDSPKSAAETKVMELIIHDDQRLRDGRRYWHQTGTESLIAEVSQKCSTIQKQALMANLLEIAMVDGVLDTGEKEFLEHVRQVLGVGTAEFNRIYDVLILKNNHTVF